MNRFFVYLLLSCFGLTLFAQATLPPIPVDENVRKGTLSNGLTYYIYHNEEPKGLASFFIAQKVGSILEEEEQRGLAHFLEHMCFNGTQKFPDNRIIKYCESIGISFGGDLNAYTSIDETVYRIVNVPLSVEHAVDSCLWILHDWADGLLLEPEEIDKERGVIHEEWRSRNSASSRMYDSILPKIYPNGNKYGHRLPIGLMSVVDSFPYQVLRDYYEKWYRPDLQGIVVVGDIDVDEIEKKIKDIFNTIETPVNPAERYYVPVESNVEPIVALAKDKEQTVAQALVMLKFDGFSDSAKVGMDYWLYQYVTDVAEMMFQTRLDELKNKANPPFMSAGIGEGEFFISKTKQCLEGYVVFDENKFSEALSTLYREILRGIRHGFLPSEYERAKQEWLSQAEDNYNSRNKKSSYAHGVQIVRHFIDNEPLPGAENQYTLAQKIIPDINVETVNAFIQKMTVDSNMVIMAMLPDKEGVVYPSEQGVIDLLKGVEKEQIAQYVDNTKTAPLVSSLPKSGKVKSTSDGPLGYTQLVFKNGVTLYYKKTDFNPNEICLYAYSPGGESLYDVSAEGLTLAFAGELAAWGGAGNFSKIELDKALAGKQAWASLSIGDYQESVSGRCVVKDFETMLQLVYLRFTGIREDREAFEAEKAKGKAYYANAAKRPKNIFADSLTATIYNHNPRKKVLLTPEQLDAINYERGLQIARERVANAADFTFILTGAIDEKNMLPLLCQYIGSLPAKGKKEKANENIIVEQKGQVTNVFSQEMETPSVSNHFYYHYPAANTLKERIVSTIANNVMDIVYTEQIREKEGGTYGVGVYGSIDTKPASHKVLQIRYETSPEKYDYLNKRIAELLVETAKDGPKSTDVQKTKDYLIKEHTKNMRENKYHQDALYNYLNYKINALDEYEQTLNAITDDDIKEMLQSLVDSGNLITVIMTPK